MQPRVLVVEDVAALRRSFALALEQGGCSAIEAGHLAEALDVACFEPPDVFIVDERVIRAEPETFRRLRTDPRLRDVLVVALSAGVQRRGDLIASGVHGVVGKPVRDHDLVAAVRWVLDVYSRPDAPRGPQ